MSAPRSARAIWSSIDSRWEGNSGWVTTIRPTPASTAASTTAKISSRARCPVARTRSWRATTSRTARSASSTAPSASTTATGSAVTPASRSSSSKRTQTGTLPSGSAARTSCCSFSELTVGSHTIRAPSRAAISTATGFSPPTARLSVIAPIVSTSGTAALTTRARSAVEV